MIRPRASELSLLGHLLASATFVAALLGQATVSGAVPSGRKAASDPPSPTGASAPLTGDAPFASEAALAPEAPLDETPTPATRIVLYDGELGTGLPDTQGMLYLSRPAPDTELAATQSFADGVTTLTTSTRTSDSAGYFPKPGLIAGLDRAAGFSVRFTMQITEEEHAASDKNGDGIADRAGWSIITLASDLRGIELGFWEDQVWAQEDGAAEPPPNSNTLFTHAESAPWDATAGLIPYDLRIQGDHYTLESRGTAILSGELRDYSVFGWPYTVPSFLFLGDDTSTASGTTRFAYAAVQTLAPGTPEATPEVTPTATAEPPNTPTATGTTPEPEDLILPVAWQR